MALRTNNGPKSAVEVPTSLDIADGSLGIELMQSAEQGKCIHGRVQKTVIDLPVVVTCEDAGGLVEGEDVY